MGWEWSVYEILKEYKERKKKKKEERTSVSQT